MQDFTSHANNGGATYKSYRPPSRPFYVPAGNVAFRLLCHASRVGGVIGKSGCIIKQLQQDTTAKIRVEDSGNNADEHRVIVVIASPLVNRKIKFCAARNEEEGEEEERTDGGSEEFEVSAAQEAVVRVFERVIEVTAESVGMVLGTGSLVSCRLLAKVNQVGSVIGKGGMVVDLIRKETGCRIKVITSENLPACTLPGDKVVEIEGEILGVKKALIAVTSKLQDGMQPEKATISDNRVGDISQEALHEPQVDLPEQSSSMLPTVPTSPTSSHSVGHFFSQGADSSSNIESKMSKQEVTFKILCPADKVGVIIGKAGTIVKALEHETGAAIRVGPIVPECYERLITITAFENLESHQSPAQRAILVVFNKLAAINSEKGSNLFQKGSFISARLLVQANQAGCLLGKGGSIIAEMRKMTGARIILHRGDQVPKCASENDEVVEITGEFVNVRDALCSVTDKLRNNLLQVKSSNNVGFGSSTLTTENTPYGRLKNGPPGPGFNHSSGASSVTNPPSDLVQSMGDLGISHNMDGVRSQSIWQSQSQIGINQRGTTNLGRGSISAKGGLELGRSAVVTNTTVEIVVPENVIGSVYGENGSNLERLRQISGAKVTMREPHPGTTDRTIVISGTPDETQTAQSLLQAFIINGSP
ncbi:KH domain-containing protein HEN4 [Ipomoea triloba]|uniref:KH domain-containing protein HEN4 n=1 Tax=Ipomoea triloba TaxID=35885 RepID=UPI00125CE3EE|nr:KH domain-containing protein HEN4 [Ipomoea triloba]